MGKKKEVIYLKSLDQINTENSDIYIANGVIRTIVKENVIYKNLSGFGGDRELAEECKQIWDYLGYAGSPSSPASFFRKSFGNPCNIKASHNFFLSDFTHGGWQENFISGSVLGEVYKYDIIKAYFWAGMLGLPSKIRCYKHGDKNFISLFKTSEKRTDVPVYFRKDKFIATSKDIETYNLKGKILHAYSWKEYDIFPNQHIYEYKNILHPKAYKMLTQSYWGIWHSFNPILVKYKNGNTRNIYNRNKNLIWSTIIIHRIIRKIWEVAIDSGINVFVDAVLTRKKIHTDNKIGSFELKKTYKDGLFIKSAGVYTPINEYNTDLRSWEKHAGYASNL